MPPGRSHAGPGRLPYRPPCALRHARHIHRHVGWPTQSSESTSTTRSVSAPNLPTSRHFPAGWKPCRSPTPRTPLRHTQNPTPARSFTQRFSATRRGARLARLQAAHQLTEWGHPHGTEAHDTVVLVVAEFASNAVLHGRVPGRDFVLFLAHDQGCGVFRIEVSDTHPAQPTQRAHGADESGGRGLLLVEALAADWGVRNRVGPGRTVWADCVTGDSWPP
ncbi:ATP-binding protein [Streptomyces sp. bgisy022]|uniref:ATP-binding protein n=1 Tax=Streptomyces sp. bgisy022 TaxID=3413769 RepID=UPI003D74600C